ncbi:hypothetical protein CKY10_11850 [Photorhabdus sp. HUG-39]|nr:hypothetical protein CKY10_11850 [Photorhabdus sp. HUG-39]
MGYKYQTGHENEIYVYSFDHDISREQNVNHTPISITKPIDKSSPLLGIAISENESIPVIFQVASLLAALAHPGHIVIYAPGDSLPCRRDASRNP